MFVKGHWPEAWELFTACLRTFAQIYFSDPPGIWLRKGVAIVQFADDPICGNPIGTSLTGIVVACPMYVDHPPMLPACLQAPQ